MNRSNQTWRAGWVLLSAMALAGCGGGGGDGGGTPPAPAGPPLAITSSNYQAVAQVAVSSAAFVTGAGGIAVGAESSSASSVLPAAKAVVLRVLSRPLSPAVAVGAETTETLACSQGGSLNFTFNDANNNNALDGGDGVTINAQSCRELGELINGRLALSVQSTTGTFGQGVYSASMQMTLSGFSVSFGTDVIRGNGSLSFSVAATATGVEDYTFAFSELTLEGTEGGTAFTHRLIAGNLSERYEVVAGVERYTTSGSMRLASSAFGGSEITVTTTSSMVTVGANLYPSSGQITIGGANQSSVRVTAVNATQARVELDANGDGVYETQVLKNWSELG